MNNRPWTKHEIELLMEHYPRDGSDHLRHWIKRSVGAINFKAAQLGLKAKKDKPSSGSGQIAERRTAVSTPERVEYRMIDGRKVKVTIGRTHDTTPRLTERAISGGWVRMEGQE